MKQIDKHIKKTTPKASAPAKVNINTDQYQALATTRLTKNQLIGLNTKH
jgi:hypothetical protein